MMVIVTSHIWNWGNIHITSNAAIDLMKHGTTDKLARFIADELLSFIMVLLRDLKLLTVGQVSQVELLQQE